MVGVVIFGVWLVVALMVAYIVGEGCDDPVWEDETLGSLLASAALWPLMLACGADTHLYGRADTRWDPGEDTWVIADMEDEIDCTNCSWAGSLRELDMKGTN